MTTPTQVADLLDRAADHIDRVGWTQGDWHEETPGLQPKDSPVCADGALAVAAYGDPFGAGGHREPDRFALHSAAVTALIRHIGAGLIDWNDAEGRTKDQVVGAMRAAAAEQREQATDAEREQQRLAWFEAGARAQAAITEDRLDRIRAMARLAHREGPWG